MLFSPRRASLVQTYRPPPQRLREIVESAGLTYLESPFIVDALQQLVRE
jgi:hypothetical protein